MGHICFSSAAVQLENDSDRSGSRLKTEISARYVEVATWCSSHGQSFFLGRATANKKYDIRPFLYISWNLLRQPFSSLGVTCVTMFVLVWPFRSYNSFQICFLSCFVKQFAIFRLTFPSPQAWCEDGASERTRRVGNHRETQRELQPRSPWKNWRPLVPWEITSKVPWQDDVYQVGTGSVCQAKT